MAAGDPCDVCGQPIPRGGGPRKRCSEPCRREARQRLWRRQYAADPDRAIGRVDAYKARHPERVAAQIAMRTPKDYAAQRVAHLRTYYGMTVDQYDAMAEAQAGRCAICRRVETGTLHGRPRPLAVDHDHLTGAVRGLLCSRCNSVLGFIEDKALFTAATDYLRRHEFAEEASS